MAIPRSTLLPPTLGRRPDVAGTLNGLPYVYGADDAPAAILPNGHVIFTSDAALGIPSSGTTTQGLPTITGIPSTAQLQVGWSVSAPDSGRRHH